MTKFAADTAVTPSGPGRYRASVNRDWWIAFGPNGGFIAAIVVRALQAAVGDDERIPRSLTIHYTAAPAEGALEVATTIERAGRSLTTVSGRVEQDGKLIALAIGAFSRDRSAGIEFDDARAPDVASPEDAFVIEQDPRMPPFSAQWDMRAAIGGPPFAAGDEAVVGGWIRPREPQPLDAALVSQLTDAWFPAVFRRLDAPNPVPTIDLTIHFRSQLPLPPDWVLVRFVSRVARHGFVEEDGELWSRDGTLIAQSRQLALLRAPSAT
ncbi:MAG: acyl-CoA thioesterase [Thermoleophilaceae bacterium]